MKQPTLFLTTSNGAGLGHVTRLMAAARRLDRRMVPVVATQSLGAPIVARQGFPVEYVMSQKASGLANREWNKYLTRRYSYLLSLYKPDVIAYDGVVPYPGMTAAWAELDVPKVWLRRGLWKPGVGANFVELGAGFDLVVEPGDVATEMDSGATALDLRRTWPVSPITYLSADELESPLDAQIEIAGEPNDRLVLVSLGAGNINDTTSDTATVIRAVLDNGYEPVLAVSPIARETPHFPGVRTVREYPVSRLLRGFAFTVAAAGYNSVHESLMSGTPALLLPNRQTGLDDQVLRAMYLERRGGALAASSPGEIRRGVRLLSDSHVRRRLSKALSAMNKPNGAEDFARVLSRLAGPADDVVTRSRRSVS